MTILTVLTIQHTAKYRICIFILDILYKEYLIPFIAIVVLLTYIIYISKKITELKTEIELIKTNVFNCDERLEGCGVDIIDAVSALKNEIEIIKKGMEQSNTLTQIKVSKQFSELKNEIEIIKKSVIQCETSLFTDITNISITITELKAELENNLFKNNDNLLYKISDFENTTKKDFINAYNDMEKINKFEPCISLFTQTDFIKIETIDNLKYIKTFHPRGIYFTDKFDIKDVDTLKIISDTDVFPTVEIIYLSSPYFGNTRSKFFKLFPNVSHIYIRGTPNNVNYNNKVGELVRYLVTINVRGFTFDNSYNSEYNLEMNNICDKQLATRYYNNLITYDTFIELENSIFVKYDLKGNEVRRMYMKEHLVDYGTDQSTMIVRYREGYRALYVN